LATARPSPADRLLPPEPERVAAVVFPVRAPLREARARAFAFPLPVSVRAVGFGGVLTRLVATVFGGGLATTVRTEFSVGLTVFVTTGSTTPVRRVGVVRVSAGAADFVVSADFASVTAGEDSAIAPGAATRGVSVADTEGESDVERSTAFDVSARTLLAVSEVLETDTAAGGRTAVTAGGRVSTTVAVRSAGRATGAVVRFRELLGAGSAATEFASPPIRIESLPALPPSLATAGRSGRKRAPAT